MLHFTYVYSRGSIVDVAACAVDMGTWCPAASNSRLVRHTACTCEGHFVGIVNLPPQLHSSNTTHGRQTYNKQTIQYFVLHCVCDVVNAVPTLSGPQTSTSGGIVGSQPACLQLTR